VALLGRLETAFPACRFSLVVGTDLVAAIPAWEQGDRLFREASFIVVDRPGLPPPETRALPAHATLLRYPDTDDVPPLAVLGSKVSSTEVRGVRQTAQARRLVAAALVPKEVVQTMVRYSAVGVAGRGVLAAKSRTASAECVDLLAIALMLVLLLGTAAVLAYLMGGGLALASGDARPQFL
jgi:hypothetical protein